MADSDDEPITLSATALAALQDFYSERDSHAEKFERLRLKAEEQTGGAEEGEGLHDVEVATDVDDDGGGRVLLSMDAFTEDWGESQFWYSDETATLLARQLLDDVDGDTVIAVVSTPSVFIALKNLMSAADDKTPRPKVYLLEHDYRFSVFSEFLFYDFTKPTKLPACLRGGVDRMIVDPPFLSEDCQTKMAMTLRYISRKPSTNATTTVPVPVPAAALAPDDAPGRNAPRVIVCTGERMEPLITKLYRPLGARTTTFEPVHAGLKNEFYCYANFECGAWRWRDGREGGNKANGNGNAVREDRLPNLKKTKGARAGAGLGGKEVLAS